MARIPRPQTARAALDTFASLGAVVLVFRDGSQLRRLSNYSPHQAELLDLLGLPSPHPYLTMHLLTC